MLWPYIWTTLDVRMPLDIWQFISHRRNGSLCYENNMNSDRIFPGFVWCVITFLSGPPVLLYLILVFIYCFSTTGILLIFSELPLLLMRFIFVQSRVQTHKENLFVTFLEIFIAKLTFIKCKNWEIWLMFNVSRVL